MGTANIPVCVNLAKLLLKGDCVVGTANIPVCVNLAKLLLKGDCVVGTANIPVCVNLAKLLLKGDLMKRNLISTPIIILLLMGTTGCSVVRLTENFAGYGVNRTPVGEPEVRRTQLSRQDLQLGISATDSGLSLKLSFLPYYHLEQRQTFTTKPRLTGVDIAVGLASAGLIGWVAYDNWRADRVYVISEDGSLKEGRTFDWQGAPLWQKAVMLGVPADFALAAILHTLPGKVMTPWEQKGEEEGTPQWLRDHPYRLELSGYNHGKNYQTTSGKNETIAIRDFLKDLKNPAPFLDTNTLEISRSY